VIKQKQWEESTLDLDWRTYKYGLPHHKNFSCFDSALKAPVSV